MAEVVYVVGLSGKGVSWLVTRLTRLEVKNRVILGYKKGMEYKNSSASNSAVATTTQGPHEGSKFLAWQKAHAKALEAREAYNLAAETEGPRGASFSVFVQAVVEADEALAVAMDACRAVGAPALTVEDQETTGPEAWTRKVWAWAESKAGEAQAAHEGGGTAWEEPRIELTRSFLP